MRKYNGSSLANCGRTAGTGIIEDSYNEESFPDFGRFGEREPMFVKSEEIEQEPCICYMLTKEELAEVVDKYGLKTKGER